MKPGSLTRYAGAALWVVLTAGCGSPTLLVGPRSVDPADWEVLQETPGERILKMTSAGQNALFATGTQHLYRLRRSEPDLWEVVDTVPDLLFSLQAPDDTTLFAIGRRPSVLYTWTEGTSWSARVLQDAATGMPVAVRMLDLWQESLGSFYISGSDNSILHVTDSTARIERVPAGTAMSDDFLWAVGGVKRGSGHPVFAVSRTRVFRRDPGGWTALDTTVVPELGRRCGGATIIALRDDLLVGGGESMCLLLLRDGVWTSLTPALGGGSGNLIESVVQADGSILLWSQANSFLVAYSGTDVRTYQFPRLGYFAGAARLNGYLYFARNDPHEQTSVFGRLHDQ